MWNPYPVKNFEEIEDELTTKVYESIGSASMCWTDIMKAGIFESEEAHEIGKKLIEDIKGIMS